MNRKQFSLMTFSMAQDVARKAMTIADTLQMAADAEIPYVDVMRVKPDKVAQYQTAMKQTSVGVCCYIAVISFFEKKERILANLDKELQVAASLGATLFMIVPFYSVVDERKAKKLDRGQVRQYMAQGFRLAVEKGNAFGLKVCFETTPQDVLCLSGTTDCKWMLAQVPGLGLAFDTANMLPHGDQTMKAYEALKDYIVHVHLKDVKLESPRFSLLPRENTPDGRIMKATVFGEGVIPVRGLYERMCEDGYSGRFAIEYIRPFGSPATLVQNEEHLQRYIYALERER